MDENVKMVLDETRDLMEKAIHHLDAELHKIRAGKASPVMLEGIRVDYYGTPTPLNQTATITAPEPRMLVVQPYEKGMISVIEKAIKEANIGVNPVNDGNLIRLPIPALSEERRKTLVKQAKDEGEKSKVAIRNVRRDHNEAIRNLKKEGVSEDEMKIGEAEVQKTTDNYIHKVEEVIRKKEQEIMTI